MSTILIDGLATEAAQIVCDPLPGDDAVPLRLELRLQRGYLKTPTDAVPIVFPYGEDLYRGEFRLVSHADYASGQMDYCFVSDGPVRQAERAELLRRIKIDREVAALAERPLDDNLLNGTTVLVIALVALTAVVAALYAFAG